MPPILLLFSAVNLVLGTAVFAITGILAQVAAGLGVGVPAAGQAMTAYAASTAVLAPLALLATGGWPRKRVLVTALGVFALGAAVSALAPSLAVLLAGRVLMGVGAVFMPVAAGITVALVGPERRGQALALVFLGMSLSYVVGLPLLTWVGLALGWRVALGAAAAVVALGWLAVMLRVPAGIDAPCASFAGLGATLQRLEVWLVLGLTLCYFVATFVVFAYIGPVLQALVPMSGARLAATLGLFGIAGVAGTLLGGWANDRFGARPTLWVQLTLLGAMSAALPLTTGAFGALLAVLLVWAAAGFGMMPPQQSRLAALAPREAPLLISLNTSVLYLGTAAGAAAGGVAAPWLGFERLAWAGLAPVAAGLLLLAARRRGAQPVAQGLH